MANKKLTSSNILSLYSKTFTQKKVILEAEGQTFEVLIDEKFQPSKIQALIMELAEQQQKIKNLDDILDISFYSSYLLIKHFTDIGIAKSVEDDFTKQIRVFKALVDLGLYDQIIDSFDKDEMNKINDYLKKANDRIKELGKSSDAMKDIESMMNDIASLENPEVFLNEENTQEQ